MRGGRRGDYTVYRGFELIRCRPDLELRNDRGAGLGMRGEDQSGVRVRPAEVYAGDERPELAHRRRTAEQVNAAGAAGERGAPSWRLRRHA